VATKAIACAIGPCEKREKGAVAPFHAWKVGAAMNQGVLWRHNTRSKETNGCACSAMPNWSERPRYSLTLNP